MSEASHRPLVRFLSIPLLLAAVLTTAVTLGGTSGATTGVRRTFAITGTMEVGAPPSLTLPAGSTLTATIEPSTGAFSDGQLSIPTFDRGPVSGPQAEITLTQLGAATGVLDPGTGISSMTVTLEATLTVPLLSATCSLGPITTTSSSGNPGGSPFAGSPLTGVVTASGYTVPAAVGLLGSPTCAPSAASAINTTLGLPTSATSLALTAVETTPAPGPIVPGYAG
ncbi:MAG: hypothetical protein EBX39_05710 [Actinobacteria bacterium]|nr:hypothetical protein [Actinomycetota bacterium]